MITPGDDLLSPVDPTVAFDAVEAVTGARAAMYGHPYVDFLKVSLMWESIFGIPVTPEQVGLAMICVKLARQCNTHARDNLVDIIGYALTVDACVQTQERHDRRSDTIGHPASF